MSQLASGAVHPVALLSLALCTRCTWDPEDTSGFPARSDFPLVGGRALTETRVLRGLLQLWQEVFLQRQKSLELHLLTGVCIQDLWFLVLTVDEEVIEVIELCLIAAGSVLGQRHSR